MNVLVTGGCGFIGSGFCRWILKNYPQHKIVNLDALHYNASKSGDLVTSTENYRFVHGDLKDFDVVLKTLRDNNITAIVNFAAQSHVDNSFSNALAFTYDNVIGTQTLLEASKVYHLESKRLTKFLHISTDEVYGENTGSEHTELSLLKPTNPYAASKAAAEMYVYSYQKSYGLPIVTIRSNNIYGPGQYPEKVIPKFISQLMKGEKLTLQGSGLQSRSFLYIDDAVSAIYHVLTGGQIGEVYNISSRDEVTIRDLARHLIRLVKGQEAVNLDDEMIGIADRDFNDCRYWIVSEPLKALGWHQEMDFEDGLKKTIAWYQNVDYQNYWMKG
ncbi:6 dehydratase [uncultured virus]|nr:6 dehydratase [uncultured virus]